MNTRNESCRDCKFYDEIGGERDGLAALGSCLRYPPVLLNKEFVEPDPDDIRDELILWGNPLVFESGWCGEWKLTVFITTLEKSLVAST